MSNITNLIGTTWRLAGDNLDGLIADYGVFNINTEGTFYKTDDPTMAYTYLSSQIACGYYCPPGASASGIVTQNGAFCVNINTIISDGEEHGGLNLFYSSVFNDIPFIYQFTITGGADISNPLFIDFINTYGTLVSGGEPPTAEGVKSKLQSLITASNAKTGKSDANLTDAVNTLLEGYGQVGGDCSGKHIIEVDELPAENIDTTALYKCGDSYYQYVEGAFIDIIVVETENSPYSLLELYSSLLGVTPELYTIKTKPTTEEGLAEIVKTDFAAGVIAIYYIEDEGDAFTYDGSAWSAMEATGIISDASEATAVGMYILAGAYWAEYVSPSGSITITENSMVDVTDKKSVIVNVPQPSGKITITENGEHDVTEYGSAYVNVPIPDGYIKPSGTKTITENGTVDVTQYASANVALAIPYTLKTIDGLPTDAAAGSLAIILGGD